MAITTFEGFGGIEPKTMVTAEELDAFDLPGGLALPPSYRDYAEHLGYGLTCGLFLIYIPMGEHCDSLSDRSEVLSRVNRGAVESEYMNFKPDGSAELVLQLFPFGISENGDVLGWDLEDERDGEYAIYRIGPRAYGVKCVARSLFEFVERCTDERVAEVVGAGYEPLEETFKPLVPVVAVSDFTDQNERTGHRRKPSCPGCKCGRV